MSSLTNLIGNYMSDTEDEDNGNEKTEVNSKNSFSKEIGSLMNEIDNERKPSTKSKRRDVETESKKSLPSTDWTQCIDPQSGHPYYWNIATKEVTWDKPTPYEKYLDEIEKVIEEASSDIWSVGYTDTQTPYYVNQFTRVVKWDKPKNFDGYTAPKNMLKFNKKINTKRYKKIFEKPMSLASQRLQEKKKAAKLENTKLKKLPEHLIKGNDEEVKIELINSYSATSSDTLSDTDSNNSDNTKENCQSNKFNEDKITKSKFNLVAAYASDDDDDDKEELNVETSVKKIEKSSEPIIVIPTKKKNAKQNKITTKKSPERPKAVSPIELDKNRPTTFASIITGGKTENCFDAEIDKLKEELERELAESTAECSEQTEVELKLSKENNSFDEKTFQRKRRIEFGVKHLVNAPKSLDENDNTSSNSSKNDSNQTVELLKKKNLYMNFQKSHVEFSQNTNVNETNDNLKIENEKTNDTLKEEIYFLSDLLVEKVNFLTVGHSEISPVQVIKIQLETLLTAYKTSALNSEYFFKWLKLTSDDIQKLEENAAPDGWICKWDRKTSQYCYENIENSKIQWEYPEDDHKDKLKIKSSTTKTANDVHGEEEMEISTTPPPNLNEQIIVKQQLPSDGNWDADNAPPPPIISAPSPPIISSMGINDELASFYSDIATIEENDESMNVTAANKDSNNIPEELQEQTSDSTKRVCEDDSAILKKKRKKTKVQGLASLKTNEVTSMVAKWHKAQKELNQ